MTTPSLHTFVFADLAGYTALTEAHGDEQAADAAAEFCAAVRGLLSDYDAEEVKAIGDALLLRADDASTAAHLAARLVGDYGVRHRGLGIRVGIHTGTAVRRGEDWFGSAVNIAWRVADLATAGQVLLSAATRETLDAAIAVQPVGEHMLKNVAHPASVFALDLRDDVGRLPVDPVCRMALDPARAAASRMVAGRDYVFCSKQCVEAFDADQATYANGGG